MRRITRSSKPSATMVIPQKDAQFDKLLTMKGMPLSPEQQKTHKQYYIQKISDYIDRSNAQATFQDLVKNLRKDELALPKKGISFVTKVPDKSTSNANKKQIITRKVALSRFLTDAWEHTGKNIEGMQKNILPGHYNAYDVLKMLSYMKYLLQLHLSYQEKYEKDSTLPQNFLSKFLSDNAIQKLEDIYRDNKDHLVSGKINKDDVREWRKDIDKLFSELVQNFRLNIKLQKQKQVSSSPLPPSPPSPPPSSPLSLSQRVERFINNRVRTTKEITLKKKQVQTTVNGKPKKVMVQDQESLAIEMPKMWKIYPWLCKYKLSENLKKRINNVETEKPEYGDIPDIVKIIDEILDPKKRRCSLPNDQQQLLKRYRKYLEPQDA